MHLQVITPVFAIAATAALTLGTPAFAQDTRIDAGSQAGAAAGAHGGIGRPHGPSMSHGSATRYNAPRNLQSNSDRSVSSQRDAARASFPDDNRGRAPARVASGIDRRTGENYQRGLGAGAYVDPGLGLGYGVNAGYGYGGDGYGYGGGYGYDGGDYAYDYPAYGDPTYGPGPQYSLNEDDSAPVQYGRSAAVAGSSCSTPVKVCTLYQPSYVGVGCSCRVPGGRARGSVIP
jgi:hypothetical protein